MDDKLKELNKFYDDIQIPDQLDQVIDEALSKGRKSEVISMEKNKISKSNKVAKWVKRVGVTAASLVVVLGITVNASSVAAENIYKIPILGEIGKIITFREYTIDNDTSVGEVTVPKVDNVENKDVEKQINDMITARVDALVEEQAQLDAEYKEAYLETGGTEETYRKVETTIDYKKHFITDKIISFEIYKYQTLAPAYNEILFYNMNLETGDSLTLKDVLGDDFASVIKETVEKQMLSRMETEDILYDVEYFKEMEITEDRGFYIQENGDIVVVFPKYEVASGSAGQQDFIVGNINQ